ncbi:A subunit of glutamyl-tRNA amidotransferase [Ascobolus immersus RN42]|uniref:Glutamyl-tRNA(Gln) amidotransferase subunit A, mitochondrial n=1 Tax=Ascobolus immersus RN42 TaxID=1160509 RepID=A0A3N4IMA5_ASCIM|nr:A subunit of glutamyl-tRNA amidotransferase [Ascobolus immersus RN42]
MSILREAERHVLKARNLNPLFNALISSRTPEGIIGEATEAETRHTKGHAKSQIDGKTIVIKDNICTTDLPTTCGSAMLKGYVSPIEATVVKSLRENGAIVLGKANMDEFGMGSHSIYSHFGPVKRPPTNYLDDAPRSAGGSSGGSAAAVAADMCFASLGTDTGGSVRAPAAYTGTVGFKPSYGRLSRFGVIPYANSLDTVGILAKSVDDVASVFRAIDHPDSKDPTNLTKKSRSRIQALAEAYQVKRRKRRLRIGVPVEYNLAELHLPLRSAWKSTISHLIAQGHTVHAVSLPTTQHALQAYYILAPAEASSNLAKYDGVRYGHRADKDWSDDGVLYANTRGEGFGAEVKRRILLGNYSLSASAMDNYFLKAQSLRRLVIQDFNRAFAFTNPLTSGNEAEEEVTRPEQETVDVFLTPTTLSPAPELEHVINNTSPIDSYVNDVLTVPASLAGIPAISVPVKMLDDVVGMQIIGQFGDEDGVLEVAKMVEGQVFC